MKQHFKVIITCRNVERWINYSIKSLLKQKYKNWSGIVIDDCSTDRTYSILEGLTKSSNKITLVRNSQRKKVLCNIIMGIRKLDPCDEDVVVILDGDDWLARPNILSYLADIYANNEIWLTWGSYVNHNGKNPNLSADYSKIARGVWARNAPEDWNVRKDWRYSHLRTCKYFLWKNIKDKDFRLKATGEYYPTAPDLAAMYPMLEMAGPLHCKFIPKVMYVYNVGNPQSWANTKKISININCATEIKNRKSYLIKTKKELLECLT